MPPRFRSKAKEGRRIATSPASMKADTYPRPSSTRNRCIINDLPAELLSHIFVLGCVLDRNKGHKSCNAHQISCKGYTVPLERRLPFELLASRVCRQWRDVIIETPLIWSDIVLTPSTRPSKVKQYIFRAKSTPLDISVRCSHLMRRIPATFAKSTKALMSHVDQWRSFQFATHDLSFLDIIMIQLKQCKSAIMLESLELTYRYHDRNTPGYPPEYKTQKFVLFHNKLPALQKLTLRGVHINWGMMTFPALHDVRLAFHPSDVRPTYRDFLNILRASKELQSLVLCASGPSSGLPVERTDSVNGPANVVSDTQSDARVCLPSVSHLDVALLPSNDILSLFDHTQFPNLTSLRMNLCLDNCQGLIDRLAASGHNGSPPLLAGIETLKLPGLLTSSPSSMFTALQSLTNMKTLHINLRRVDFTTWANLLPVPTPSVDDEINPPNAFASTEASISLADAKDLFPRLEAIYITGISGASVKSMVVQRRKNGHPLKKVYLNMVDWVTPDDEVWLKQNLEVFEIFDDPDDEDLNNVEDENEDNSSGADYDAYYDSDV